MILVRIIKIICILFPTFVVKFIYSNISIIHTEEVVSKYGQLFKEFRESTSRISYKYYVLFMIRRFNLAFCLHFIRNYPVAQVSAISLSCWSVVMFLMLFKPYLDKLTNIAQILVEICVAIAYTVPGLLIYKTLDRETVGWIVTISINLSYIIQLLPILYKAIQKLYAKIKAKRVQNRLNDQSRQIDTYEASQPSTLVEKEIKAH